MVAISLSESGEGPGWETAPGYSTAAFFAPPLTSILTTPPSWRISPFMGEIYLSKRGSVRGSGQLHRSAVQRF